jgi:hypothetical protein
MPYEVGNFRAVIASRQRSGDSAYAALRMFSMIALAAWAGSSLLTIERPTIRNRKDPR